MVLLSGNMLLWSGYVWDVDAKKWDLWKAMRSYARRFLTWKWGDGRFLGGLGWESGRPQSDGSAQSGTGAIAMRRTPP